MTDQTVVPQEEWVAIRKKLLEKEKEASKLREELTALRQSLPWEKVDKQYTFDGPNGKETLADLFADHYNPSIIHLKHRHQVSFTPEQAQKKETYYNYRVEKSAGRERPGISVFQKSGNGDIFHTYSSYGRGLENFIGAYNLLDIVPKGRDEADLKNGMDWVRRHDQYEDGNA
jgi:predicted dithiol-disulfide oxidoreductase (DUF899 family)